MSKIYDHVFHNAGNDVVADITTILFQLLPVDYAGVSEYHASVMDTLKHIDQLKEKISKHEGKSKGSYENILKHQEEHVKETQSLYSELFARLYTILNERQPSAIVETSYFEIKNMVCTDVKYVIHSTYLSVNFKFAVSNASQHSQFVNVRISVFYK